MKINKLLFTLAIASVTVSQFSLSAQAKTADLNNVIIEEEGEMNYSDVSPNHWAYKSIKKLVEDYGVLGGFPDGTFRGNRNLTRYEAAAMVSKVMEKVEEMTSKTGAKPSGLNQSALDKLKKEFMSELEDLQSEVKKLSKEHQDMQKDLDETKDQVDALKDMMPKFKFMGEVSVRDEAASVAPFDMNNFLASVPQVKMRLGVKGENNGSFEFGARLSTTTDLTDPYVALGTLGTSLGLTLDKAYVAWKPWDGALNLTAGRTGLPFVKATELVWDEDLTLDGAYLKLRFGDMDNHLGLYGGYNVFGFAGGLPLFGQLGSDAAKAAFSGLYSAGACVHFGGDAATFMLGGNYHQYVNLDKAGDKFKSTSKYQLATGSLMFSLMPKAYLPLNLHADVSYNLGATADNLGLIGGLSLGKLVDPGNVLLGYQYRMVGTNSVYAPFMEDELGTNMLAHHFTLGVQMAPATSLKLTFQMGDKLTGKTDADKTGYSMRAGVTQKF